MPKVNLEQIVFVGAAVALLAVCCGLAAPLDAQDISASHSKLASYDWSVKASPNLAVRPPPQKDVESFLNRLQLSLGGDAEFVDNGNERVCSYTFANLRRNGLLSLIAGFGITDTGMCRGVYIIDKTVSGFET